MTIPWNQETKIFIIVILAVITLIAILAFIIELIKNNNSCVDQVFIDHQGEKEKPKRELLGITIDTENVIKEYKAGEKFNADGLVVTANFSLEPFTEEVINYQIQSVDMYQIGIQDIFVNYENRSANFKITINPEIVEEELEIIYDNQKTSSKETIRYNRSFTSHLIQSSDETKDWYTELKNYLLSFKKVKSRMSWKRESFRYGKELFAKLKYRGKTLCLFLPLNAKDFEDTKYKVEDVSDYIDLIETPCMYRIKNNRRVKYAKELIALVASNFDTHRIDSEYINYYVPYEDLQELINKGLIKRKINRSLF